MEITEIVLYQVNPDSRRITHKSGSGTFSPCLRGNRDDGGTIRAWFVCMSKSPGEEKSLKHAKERRAVAVMTKCFGEVPQSILQVSKPIFGKLP